MSIENLSKVDFEVAVKMRLNWECPKCHLPISLQTTDLPVRTILTCPKCNEKFLGELKIPEPEKKFFDCYTCKFRGSLPGDTHSCCKHPAVKDEKSDPFSTVLGILAGVGRVPPVIAEGAKKLNIEGDPHGIRKGWFNWPWSFDPTWPRNCSGYEAKEGVNKK